MDSNESTSSAALQQEKSTLGCAIHLRPMGVPGPATPAQADARQNRHSGRRPAGTSPLPDNRRGGVKLAKLLC